MCMSRGVYLFLEVAVIPSIAVVRGMWDHGVLGAEWSYTGNGT